MKRLQILFFIISIPFALSAQTPLTKPLVDTASLTGMATRWNDSVAEWDIFTTESESRGELRLTSVAQDDWSRWQYHGWFEVYTAYEGDLRDWIVVDELSDEVPLPMRMLLGFLVVYHSTPKL